MMKKICVYLLLLIVIVESLVCILFIRKNNQIDIIITNDLRGALVYIKQNIEDTLYAKNACDVNYISEMCSEFEVSARIFSVVYPKSDLSNLEELVQEYKKMILYASVNGYNDVVENKVRQFQQYFDIIDVNADKNTKNFRDEIKKFNDDIDNYKN